MLSFVPDTSVLVAAALVTHSHHARARSELLRRLAAGERMLLSAHSLVECYSTLTRMPPPNRFAPAEAHVLVRQDYAERGTVLALGPEDVMRMLETAANRSIAGGRIYDAITAEIAERAAADVLLTFNLRDFEAIVRKVAVQAPQLL